MANSEWRVGKDAMAHAEPTLHLPFAIRHSPFLLAIRYSPFAETTHG
jgi:hypothetical protein